MNKIIELKFGSHLYGTNTENSDLDFKGIYLPTAREICLNSYSKTISTTRPKGHAERNNKDDVDLEFFSLDRYLELLLEGQTVALDMLFHPDFRQGTMITQWIYMNKCMFLNKNINAFVGYARHQAAKYGVKGFRVAALRETVEFLSQVEDKLSKLKELDIQGFVDKSKNEHITITNCKGPQGQPEPHLEVNNRKIPFHATVKYALDIFTRIFNEYGQRALQAERNEGIDWKALSHAVRVNSEAVELLKTEYITFPRPDKELLLKIKLGQLSYKEVATIIEQGLEELESVQKASILREAPDKQFSEDFLYNVYSDVVNGKKCWYN